MSDKKPWEEYQSDDPKVLAEQERTKKLKLRKPPELGSPKPAPKATDAWSRAGQFTRRNQKVAEATAPLRKAIPGQGE